MAVIRYDSHYFGLYDRTGKNVIKTTMGLSVLWLPFFGTAHLAAHFTGADTGGYSEPYKFFLLVSALVYLLIGLLYLRKILLASVSDKVAALIGLISLIRPTNVIILLFFILYGIGSIREMKNRIIGLARDYSYLFVMALVAGLVCVPQMIYWKEMTGQWVYFSYL